MEFDFGRYVEEFNLNDDESMVKKYYTEDLVVEGPDGTMRGREQWLGMLKFVHTGVKEELKTVVVVRDGNHLMAEENAVFTATADRPDFPFGPLKAGQSLTMKFFASYRLRGNQVAHLTLGFWPPGARSF